VIIEVPNIGKMTIRRIKNETMIGKEKIDINVETLDLVPNPGLDLHMMSQKNLGWI